MNDYKIQYEKCCQKCLWQSKNTEQAAQQRYWGQTKYMLLTFKFLLDKTQLL